MEMKKMNKRAFCKICGSFFADGFCKNGHTEEMEK